MNPVEFFAWVTSIFGILGAYEVSKNKKNVNLKKGNFLFALQNGYSIFYFLITAQYHYAILQTVFIFFSIKGIFKNNSQKETSLIEQISEKKSIEVPN